MKINVLGIKRWPEPKITGVIPNSAVPGLDEAVAGGVSGGLESYLGLGVEDTLIGAWIFDPEPRPDPNTDFAAIVGPEFTQVVWSRETRECALTSSGLFPGQGDLTRAGDYTTFTLPPFFYGDVDDAID